MCLKVVENTTTNLQSNAHLCGVWNLWQSEQTRESQLWSLMRGIRKLQVSEIGQTVRGRSTLFFGLFSNCIVPMGFLPCEIRGAFPGESQLQQSRAAQPRVHAGCFSVSITHGTVAWTTGSLTCAKMLMHAIAHRSVRTA